ncbi:AMP-binding protein [Micromonospora sp. R77]|uniref:AMP-binding protein n=1 Tax=Micromonospora sp. R77 TaxID=2925836 RepID=UPI001F620839|nr:AMP-binding protein [Micromonospora sp. R77]MCI4061257.1 AMP-binding protein [Micromonospora sp. R77]
MRRSSTRWSPAPGARPSSRPRTGPAGPPRPGGTGGALPPDTCLLLTTSGSTGLPKIVPLSAAGVERFVDWAAEQFDLTEGTRVLNYAPLNFDLCLLDVWATLSHGGEVVLVDPARAVQPRYLLELFAQARPAVVQAVPMLFRLLTEAADGQAFPAVRHVLLTGDHTPRRVRAGLPAVFPRATFHNVYGCTETNDSFLHTFGPEQAATDDVLPLGRPIPGVEVALLDQGQVLTGPGTGELVVATPFQADGYLGDQAPDRFFRRVTDRGERTWYRTGDLVHRGADGRLTLAGRNDFQVKVRGVRVNLEEVERVVQGHDGVVEAVVVALPDPAAGTRLHAVVRVDGTGPSSLALRTYCAARLTRVAIPDVFRLVSEALPVGPTGKVDRRRVRDHLMRELT